MSWVEWPTLIEGPHFASAHRGARNRTQTVFVPKGPFRPKNSAESKVATVRENTTAIAKRYGECSEVLVFLKKKRQENGTDSKNYGGSKILRNRVPY